MNPHDLAFVAIIVAALALIAVVYGTERRATRRRRRDPESLARAVGVLREPDYMGPWRSRKPGHLPERNGRVS